MFSSFYLHLKQRFLKREHLAVWRKRRLYFTIMVKIFSANPASLREDYSIYIDPAFAAPLAGMMDAGCAKTPSTAHMTLRIVFYALIQFHLPDTRYLPPA